MLSKLEVLNLRENSIKAIHKNTFASMVDLSVLDLSGNNITIIQDGAFDRQTLPKLHNLYIDSTHLICDCHLSWFHDWLNSVSGDRSNGIDVRCADPPSMRNKRLIQLHKDNLTCCKE